MESTNCVFCIHTFSSKSNFSKHCKTARHAARVIKCTVIEPVLEIVPFVPIVHYEQIIQDLTQQLAEANRQLDKFRQPVILEELQEIILQIEDGYDTEIEEEPTGYDTEIEEEPFVEPTGYDTEIEEEPFVEPIIEQVDIQKVEPVNEPDEVRVLHAEYSLVNNTNALIVYFVSGNKRSTSVIHENFKHNPMRNLDIEIMEIVKQDLLKKYTTTKIVKLWNLCAFNQMQIFTSCIDPIISVAESSIPYENQNA